MLGRLHGTVPLLPWLLLLLTRHSSGVAAGSKPARRQHLYRHLAPDAAYGDSGKHCSRCCTAQRYPRWIACTALLITPTAWLTARPACNKLLLCVTGSVQAPMLLLG